MPRRNDSGCIELNGGFKDPPMLHLLERPRVQLQRLIVVAQQRVLPGLLQHQGQLAHGRRDGSRQRRLDVHGLFDRRRLRGRARL